MADFRLIATDLDGTLVGGPKDVRFLSSFGEEIARLRAEKNVCWAVCTGRTFRGFRSMFDAFEMMGIGPDFVIARHGSIVELRNSKRAPHLLWNWRIRRLAWMDRLRSAWALRQWREAIQRQFRRVRMIVRERGRLCVRLDTEADAVAAAELLKEREKLFRHLRVFRKGLEIEVRMIPFTKGLAVAELARRVGVEPAQVLAVCDGRNDLAMVAEEVARLVGCPRNAARELMDEVHRRGGHIARAPSIEGVMEILTAFENDAVRSDFPDERETRAKGIHASSCRHTRFVHVRKRGAKRRIAFAFLALYVVLAAFASFDLLPFSRLLMKPMALIDALVRKVAGCGVP